MYTMFPLFSSTINATSGLTLLNINKKMDRLKFVEPMNKIKNDKRNAKDVLIS